MKHAELLLPIPNTRIKGRVESIQILEGGIIVAEYPGFDNLVLDAGLDMVGSGGTGYAQLSTACAIGTGNAAPAVGQTTLQAQSAFTVTYLLGAGNFGTNNPSPHIFEFKRTYDFLEGSLNGNYSELGFGPAGSANMPLFSRLLIQVGGVPAAITVTSAQRLRLVYTVTVTFSPITDTAFALNFGGNIGAITGVYKMQNVSSQIKTFSSGNAFNNQGIILDGGGSGGWFTAADGAALSAVGAQTVRNTNAFSKLGTASAYVAGTYQRDKSVTFAVTEANGTIQSFGLGHYSSSSYGGQGLTYVMDVPKTKLATNTLTINARTTWGR
jgi:hypothetical protein